jgi:hypothetical protein
VFQVSYTRNGHNLTFLPEVARLETSHSQYKWEMMKPVVRNGRLFSSNRVNIQTLLEVKMRNNYWSKVTWLILGLVPLLLIACGGGSTAPASAPAADEPVVSTVAPVVEEPTVEAMDVVEEVEAEMDDEILPVSAKPQLIEFYADW